MLQHKDNRVGLDAAFQKIAHEPLRDRLQRGFKRDAKSLQRALLYFDEGGLRLADKLYFAMTGAGTSVVTLKRLLAAAHADKDVEAQFVDSYGSEFKTVAALPDAARTPSRIAGALREEMPLGALGLLGAEDLTECRARLAFGHVRPIDHVRIAIQGAGTDVKRLFEHLLGIAPATAIAEYKASYDGDLKDELTSLTGELSGNNCKRAEAYFSKEGLSLSKNVALMIGTFSTDEEAIFAAIDAATPTQRQKLRADLDDPASEVAIAFNGPLNGLNARDRARIDAQLRQDAAPGQAAAGDTAITLLQCEGGLDLSTVYETIKTATPVAWRVYSAGFHDRTSKFRDYVDANTTAVQKGRLHVVLSREPDSFMQRVRWALSGLTDNEAYFFHLLTHFTRESTGSAGDPSRRDLLEKDEFAGFRKLIEVRLDPDERSQARTLLRPADLTTVEKAAWVKEQIRLDRSGVDMPSHTGEALDDEQRELQAAVVRARADGVITPDEQQAIDPLQKGTEGALATYVEARDELEGYAVGAVTLAIGALAAPLTGGGSLAAAATALARAALVAAMTRLVAEKLVKGDRFELTSNKALAAFASGAADGVLNVVGADIAAHLMTPLLQGTRFAAAGTLPRVGQLLTQCVEGGVADGVSGAIETALTDKTWERGVIGALETIGADFAGSAASGAGMSAATAGLGILRGAVSRRRGGRSANSPRSGKLPQGTEPRAAGDSGDQRTGPTTTAGHASSGPLTSDCAGEAEPEQEGDGQGREGNGQGPGGEGQGREGDGTRGGHGGDPSRRAGEDRALRRP